MSARTHLPGDRPKPQSGPDARHADHADGQGAASERRRAALRRSATPARAAGPIVWWLLAGGAPVLTGVGVLIAEADRGAWFTLPHAVLRQIGADAFILDAALLVVVAPLAGVAMTSRWLQSTGGGVSWWSRTSMRNAWTALSPLGIAIALFIAVSGVVALAGWGARREALQVIAVSHVTLGAAALALAALGAFCASAFRDTLDAAACSLAVALSISWGALVAGPPVGDLPLSVLNAALLASPIVATASAANIDIFRSGTLYQLSPVAHGRFDYPMWYFASAWYLVIAVACFAGLARNTRSSGPLLAVLARPNVTLGRLRADRGRLKPASTDVPS